MVIGNLVWFILLMESIGLFLLLVCGFVKWSLHFQMLLIETVICIFTCVRYDVVDPLLAFGI